MPTNEDLAQAFSAHRFAETYDFIGADIVWSIPGQEAIVGREAVIAACEETASALAATSVSVERFLVVADGDAVAVDSITRYEDADGVSIVSSGDFYEFRAAELVAITSYTVQLQSGP